VAGVRLPKPYTVDELQALRRAMAGRPDVAAAAAFLEETGLRVSEFAALSSDQAGEWPRPPWWCRRACPKHGAMVRVVGKGDKERSVVLTPRALRAAAVLQSQPRRSAQNGARTPSMASDTGNGASVDSRSTLQPNNGHSGNGSLLPWTDRGLRWLFSEAGKLAGVWCHPHRYRHTWITQLVEAGNPIEIVADMAGHTSIETTRLYFLLSERAKWGAMRRRGRWLRRG
jgi:integrase